MEKLMKLLSAKGVTKTEEELRQYIESRGMNPDALNDADIVNLSNALLGSITTSKGTKATTTKKRSPRTPNNLDAAIKKVAHQTSRELDELTNAIEQGADQYSQAQAQRMLDSLANVPNQTVQYFADLAEGYEGDPEGFRGLGNEISQAIFGNFTTVTAE